MTESHVSDVDSLYCIVLYIFHFHHPLFSLPHFKVHSSARRVWLSLRDAAARDERIGLAWETTASLYRTLAIFPRRGRPYETMSNGCGKSVFLYLYLLVSAGVCVCVFSCPTVSHRYPFSLFPGIGFNVMIRMDLPSFSVVMIWIIPSENLLFKWTIANWNRAPASAIMTKR